MSSTRRNLSLDLLRAVAILLVVIRHGHVCPQASSGVMFEITSFLQGGGWVGVDLFFVLSGFLIGGLLFQEHLATGGIEYGRFLLRRAFKIYPLFWLALAVVVGVRAVLGLVVERSAVFADLFFCASYVQGVLGVSWSLAVEEHFYLLLPLVLLLLARFSAGGAQPFRRLPLVATIVAASCLLMRALTFNAASFNIFTDFNATHLRLDGLFFGVFLAYCHTHRREAFLAFAERNRSRLLLYGILGLLPPFFLPLASWYVRVPGFTVQWLASGALLVAALAWRPKENLLSRTLAACGRQSYATYLFHYFIGTVGIAALFNNLALPLNWWTYIALYLGLSFGTGALLTRFVEGPVLALRDRLVPARRRSANSARVVQEPAVLAPASGAVQTSPAGLLEYS